MKSHLGVITLQLQGICEQSGTEIILNRADVYILCIKPDETKVT